tara:strand:- start:252 stop:575 length:324 start_codon:yes stop_codon:yes gene_type:complete
MSTSTTHENLISLHEHINRMEKRSTKEHLIVLKEGQCLSSRAFSQFNEKLKDLPLGKRFQFLHALYEELILKAVDFQILIDIECGKCNENQDEVEKLKSRYLDVVLA